MRAAEADTPQPHAFPLLHNYAMHTCNAAQQEAQQDIVLRDAIQHAAADVQGGQVLDAWVAVQIHNCLRRLELHDRGAAEAWG